jgi:hypothetical protein
MRPAARVLGLLMAATAYSCTPHPTLEPIPPVRYLAAGDTATFGRGPIALDPDGRLMRFDLRTTASMVTFRMTLQHVIVLMDNRHLPAGLHTIPPWRPGAPPQRPFTSAAGTPQTSFALSGAFRPGQEAMLIVVTDEDWRMGIPRPMPSNVMAPNYALEQLGPALLRRPSSAWAAYLIVP